MGNAYLTQNIKGDLVNMEGRISSEHNNNIPIETISVKELISQFNSFNNFETTILSIDIEGIDFECLQEFLKLGFRPSIIIIETFRYNRNHINEYVKNYDYMLLDVIHWNSIYCLERSLHH
jgi:hypothetical protein